MAYTRKVTTKGQVTIPKKLRDQFGIDADRKVVIYADPDSERMIVKPIKRFSGLAEEIKIENGIDPVKARDVMEENYERS